jgi:HSP20 family protein
MNVRSLLPFSSNRSLSQRRENDDPSLALYRQMNSIFDDFFRGFGLPPALVGVQAGTAPTVLMPRIDISETDKEIEVIAELPGIDPANVDVMLDDDVLTIRGEKSKEREEKDRDYHVVERTQGNFMRSLALPFSVDPSQVAADFANGVLKITIPKPHHVQNKMHRIEVKTSESDVAGGKTQFDRAAAGDKPAGADKPTASGEQATPSTEAPNTTAA